MADFPCQFRSIRARNEASRGGASTPSTALEHNTYTGGADMSRWGQYTDSESNFNTHYENGGAQ